MPKGRKPAPEPEKVWIELMPGTEEEMTHRAKLGSAVIRKLAQPADRNAPDAFIVVAERGQFRYARQDSSFCYRTLLDNGDWFSLDYLAKEP